MPVGFHPVSPHEVHLILRIDQRSPLRSIIKSVFVKKVWFFDFVSRCEQFRPQRPGVGHGVSGGMIDNKLVHGHKHFLFSGYCGGEGGGCQGGAAGKPAF